MTLEELQSIIDNGDVFEADDLKDIGTEDLKDLMKRSYLARGLIQNPILIQGELILRLYKNKDAGGDRIKPKR